MIRGREGAVIRDQKTKLSCFISLVLRHKPEAAGIQLDEHGWASVEALIQGVNGTGRSLDYALLEEIVRTDEKGRYSFNEDRTKIRANQGHSLPVDVELREAEAPAVLYHGTATRFLDGILREGLKPMGRLYVHLSKDYDAAVKVGSRHGKPAVLRVDAAQMQEDGFQFYLSQNSVWLTKQVPYRYLCVVGA